MSPEDEDSIIVNIEMTKQEKAKAVSLLSSWQFNLFVEEPGLLKMFLVVSDIYLRNLIDKKEEPTLSDDNRKRLGLNCILLQSFNFTWLTQDGTHRNGDDYRGELVIYFHPYKGLEVIVRLGQLQTINMDFFFAKLIYYGSNQEIRYKTYHFNKQEQQGLNSFSFIIEDKDFDTYFKPKLAIQLSFRMEITRERKFRGIQNQGNTCYMNSTLQILYFLRPLRKIVLEYDGKSQLMLTLKDIFIELMDVNSQSAFLRSVNASDLLSAFGRFPDPRKQQDIHQFLLGFLQQLQNECPQLKQLWIGNGRQELLSRQQQKPYKSTILEQFNEIDLQLEDHKGNILGRLSQSLHLLLEGQKVEDKIQTDEYGKVEVVKVREFDSLPNVVFFNLKRYKYRKDKNRPVKILADFQYPPEISLSFLQGTPTGFEEDYCLFGVAVHCGQAYNSGHYYSFVNTSQDPQKPYWIKFNDSIVQLSSQETALSFTGGKCKSTVWSKQFQRFVEKENVSEDTAYLLVYIRRDKFKLYQVMPTVIPREWLAKKKAKQEKESNSPTQEIQVYLFDQKVEFDPFGDVASFPISLKRDESVHTQLSNAGNSLFGCEVGTVWKVSKRNQKIKQLADYADLPQTPSRIFGYKRGHSIPDYLLVIPQTHKVFRSLLMEKRKNQQLGIINIVVRQQQAGRIHSYARVVNKIYLDDYLAQQQKQLEKKGHIEEKDRFMYDWTDYCKIIFD